MKKANSSKSCELRRCIHILCWALWVCLLGTYGQGIFAQSPPHSGGWVVIGVEDYQALRTKAFPEQIAPEPPPIDATLSRVEYDLHVNGELATGEATLTIDVLKEGWVSVAIPSGLFASDARLVGKPVSLVTGAPDGSVLLPLEKAHSGDEAPAFAVELVYLRRGAAWSDKGQLKLTLPALDLPVSRTGLRPYHPPSFHVTAETGTFRSETYAEPSSAVLVEGEGGAMAAGVGGGVYSQVAPPPAE
jgi:hypothetical protein